MKKEWLIESCPHPLDTCPYEENGCINCEWNSLKHARHERNECIKEIGGFKNQDKVIGYNQALRDVLLITHIKK